MIRTVYLFTILVFFNLLSISANSDDIIRNIDLIPIKNFSLIQEVEHSFNINETNNSLSDNAINNLKPSTISKINYGFLSKKNLKISYNLELKKTNFKRNSQPKKYENNDLKFKIKILDLFETRSYPDWKLFTGINFSYKKIDDFECYEDQNFIVMTKSSSCENKLKVKFNSINSKKVLTINANSFGHEIGFRRSNSTWGRKNTYEFGLMTNLNKYNIEFDQSFQNVSSNYLNDFPQSTYWASYNIYSSFRQSRKLDQNWALGLGVTIDKTIMQNYLKPQNEKVYKDNIRLNLQLSRKINKNFYFGIGGLFAKNHLIGLDPISISKGKNGTNADSFSELQLKLGYINNIYIKNNKINDNLLEIINTTNFIKKTEKIDSSSLIITENLNITKTNQSKKRNIFMNHGILDKNLKDYALEYAKIFDDQTIIETTTFF